MTINKWTEVSGPTFREELEIAGIAHTRIHRLDKALYDLHAALCQLDRQNLRIMKEQFPEVVEVAKMWVWNQPFLNKLND